MSGTGHEPWLLLESQARRQTVGTCPSHANAFARVLRPPAHRQTTTLADIGIVVCPTCNIACVHEGSRIGSPAIVMERDYCPRCGWSPIAGAS